jgi:DNA-directed RNA polymerase specialized sigma24 family protein
MRPCHIDDCHKPARTGRRLCDGHRTRITRHGNPHHTEWSVADDHDVQVLIREQRPAAGLTRLERVKVAQGLTDHGLPAAEIARILTVAERTVYRWRAEGFRQAA